jgi:protein-disulfide isomerase
MHETTLEPTGQPEPTTTEPTTPEPPTANEPTDEPDGLATPEPPTTEPPRANEPTDEVDALPTPSRRPRTAIVLLGGVAIGIVLAVGGLLGVGALRPGGASASPGVSPDPSPSARTVLPAEGSSLGLASASVTIEIWADFQCPYCALQAHGIEPSIVRDQVATGAARLVFRDFAFLGQESTEAAVAAHCAEAQGRFWDYHDLLYASQQGENRGAFSRKNLLGLGRFAGLDEVAFSACLDDPSIAKAVADETAEGRGHGIESTPTLRISGPGGTTLLTGVKDAAAVTVAVLRAATPAASPAGSTAPGASATP